MAGEQLLLDNLVLISSHSLKDFDVIDSLRNWAWYKQALAKIRQMYPQYRIAIVAIDAPNDMIESNIQKRAKETGRHIPHDLRQASVSGIKEGIRELTHLVDMVAYVCNGSEEDDKSSKKATNLTEPVLKSVSLVDRSGNWELIREICKTC